MISHTKISTVVKGRWRMKKDYGKLWTLFRSMFVLSACTFGGGFVIVSLMKKRYVEELGWLEEEEMLYFMSNFAQVPISQLRWRSCGQALPQ